MRPRKGFTLIEIMTVVIIIGIVCALAAPNFGKGYSRFQLDKTTDDLINVSRWAQAMAIGQGRIYALYFSVDRHAYGIQYAKDAVDPDDRSVFEPVPGPLGHMHLVPDAVHIRVHDDKLEFYPDGTIDPTTIEVYSSQRKELLSTVAVRGLMTRVNDE